MLDDDLQQFVMPMPEKKINHIVREFQKNLQQRTTFMFIHQAKALYQLLIAPIRKQLVRHPSN
jgi:CHAT domain-containing protein